jgi:hypothetical protein
MVNGKMKKKTQNVSSKTEAEDKFDMFEDIFVYDIFAHIFARRKTT